MNNIGKGNIVRWSRKLKHLRAVRILKSRYGLGPFRVVKVFNTSKSGVMVYLQYGDGNFLRRRNHTGRNDNPGTAFSCDLLREVHEVPA